MNPSSIGELSEQDILNFTKKASPEEEETLQQTPEIQDIKPEKASENSVEGSKIKPEEASETPVEGSEGAEHVVEGQETLNVNLKDSDETRLLFQDFLLDSNASVGETLYKSGVEVVDFERFECGETQAEEVKQQSAGVGI